MKEEQVPDPCMKQAIKRVSIHNVMQTQTGERTNDTWEVRYFREHTAQRLNDRKVYPVTESKEKKGKHQQPATNHSDREMSRR